MAPAGEGPNAYFVGFVHRRHGHDRDCRTREQDPIGVFKRPVPSQEAR
jgi:hypothetical protein